MAKKFLNRIPIWLFKYGINLWPPFLGNGIKVTSISKDFRSVEVKLKMHWYNKNYVGTHFGGAMFAMSDPFFMLILLKNLSSKYIVWDKAATIHFKKPARGTLTANFSFTANELTQIANQASAQIKFIFDKQVDIYNEAREIVATVSKKLYVKDKTKDQHNTEGLSQHSNAVKR